MATMELRRGQAALEGGRADEAVAHFQESLQYRSDNVEALAGLARAFVARGDDESARFIAERAVEVSSGRSVSALDALAAVRWASGDASAALEAAEEGLRLARERGDQLLADSLRLQIRRYREGGG